MAETLIEKGDLLGACPEHGIIPERMIQLDFPVTATCSDCGAELKEVIVAPADAKVSEVSEGMAKVEVAD